MKALLLLTTFFVAITTGILYGYACSVNPGLRKLSDAEYLHAMQEINRAILNPWFFACFVGPLLTYLATCFIMYQSHGVNETFLLTCSSALLYFFGVFIITIVKNVPLNDALDQIHVAESSVELLHNHRRMFEVPWNLFHLVRTTTGVVALIILLLALGRSR